MVHIWRWGEWSISGDGGVVNIWRVVNSWRWGEWLISGDGFRVVHIWRSGSG